MPQIKLPITRYYGSKRKLVEKIWDKIDELELDFNSILDVFGGTGSFSYYAKRKNKLVIYNDIFKFNSIIGTKLIEHDSNELTLDEALSLLEPVDGREYQTIINDHFRGIYFTDIENQQIDTFVQNIDFLENENKKASAYYLLFQSCIIKRPYNLFHRNNLNMRLNYAGGNFGNKKTWERPFEELFERFTKELNNFCFSNGLENRSINFSALNCTETADLVYIDPPYFTKKSNTSYHSKYHFLEGLCHYNEILDNINVLKNNKEIMLNMSNEFESKTNFLNDLNQLFNLHLNSHIVISYRNMGIPTIQEIADLLLNSNPNLQVSIFDLGNYGYALNKNNSSNNEFLIIGRNMHRRAV